MSNDDNHRFSVEALFGRRNHHGHLVRVRRIYD
jgi:hypothetical protein